MAVTCETCAYRDTLRQGASLVTSDICRGMPPTVAAIPSVGVSGPQVQVVTLWPAVNIETDFCGMHSQLALAE